MDLHLKQWRNQHQSEQHPSSKMPKLLDCHQPHHHQQQHHQQPLSASSALPLFSPEPNSKFSNLSAISADTTTATNIGFPSKGMGSHFSLSQWQELELQALIYRYMLAGAAIPSELLQPIKKSLLHSASYILHHPLQHFSHYQPACYWGRLAMDPEPGRCRRTDGKKWRCSRDVVAGQKYCERHVHRGRNRSRKPVEIPTNTATISSNADGGDGLGGGCGVAAFSTITPPSSAPSVVGGVSGTTFSFSAKSPSVDLLHHLDHSSLDSRTETKGLFGPQNEVGKKPDGHILRHFFDDWPRSVQESENAGSNASPMNSATCLSISMPGNSSSDVSLKLSTGNGEEAGSTGGSEREQPHLNWGAAWSNHQVASMGGPLAEVLRSSASNSSPTSVLHQLPRSTSETSAVSI
ncbi:hypothetical protein K2173_001908 [Erythroxylum novogranatense]|uniref:Growth-regulating factor n=1 Tax=Erythroxylum novogranatense TaxID=1862640 RepID=A0AAV8SPP5_9ROSI|nr:hypothetical protein K2173_001908 [Erythroxylum novogranatense]